jgi:AmmeMemoRadiSam system protein B
MMPYPPVRYLDAVQIEHEGQPLVLLRDLEGLFSETLAVSLPFFLVMSLLDGERGAAEVQQILAEATGGGAVVTAEDIDRIVQELDSFYLLENARAAARREQVRAEYEALAVRPAAHAGAAYPEEPDACAKMFDELFAGLPCSDGERPLPRGLMLPHIDLRVGGRCLAEGYTRLDPKRPPRLYIILGVAHQPARNLFTLTAKDFATPLGVVQTDPAAVARLRELYGAERLSGDFCHKQEHSVEFQAVTLQYFHRENPDFKILPILCGSLHEQLLVPGDKPIERRDVRDFVQALQAIVEDYDGDVCIIASVDLSHVGLKFGDSDGVDELRATLVQSADALMIERVEAVDAESFFDHFRPDANARNVDAVTSVYVMLHALGNRGRGERINYQQWKEEETDSMVTYASVAIY